MKNPTLSGFITLLPGEGKRVVLNADNGLFGPTTKRIRFSAVVWGGSNLTRVTLSSVTSCGLVTTSDPLWIVAGILLLLAGLVGGRDAASVLIILGRVLEVPYVATRRVEISIASNSGRSIPVPMRGITHASAVAFMEAPEQEKPDKAQKTS